MGVGVGVGGIAVAVGGIDVSVGSTTVSVWLVVAVGASVAVAVGGIGVGNLVGSAKPGITIGSDKLATAGAIAGAGKDSVTGGSRLGKRRVILGGKTSNNQS